MKILMINIVSGIRSTGRICTDLADALMDQGNDVAILYGRGDVPEKYKSISKKTCSNWNIYLNGIMTRLFDSDGFNGRGYTKKIVKWIESYNPDVIHLHNLHGYYIDCKSLFEYLKTSGKKIIWTLHDCWAFTGHCSYFEFAACEKWKSGCETCQQKKEYPTSLLLDRSKRNYEVKKKLFQGVPDLTIVTPSYWLANLVKLSFLSEYEIKVIHNGINTNVFSNCKSTVKERLKCSQYNVILGVAAVWTKRKGYNTFIELAKKLDPTWRIILVGLRKEQIESLPDNIIGLESTNNTKELAELYSAADVFLNPTLEDNYPTTNVEAISCGTPVITFNTGGSPESASLYGCTVKNNDINELLTAIYNFKELVPKYDRERLSSKYCVYEYLKLYNMNDIGVS